MSQHKIKLLALLALFLFSHSVLASTAIEYKTDCTYIDAKKTVRFNGKCDANFGIVGADGRGVRYILTFPNNKSVEIFVYNHHDLALVNGIAAKLIIPKGKGRLSVVTGENEQFIFGGPPQENFGR